MTKYAKLNMAHPSTKRYQQTPVPLWIHIRLNPHAENTAPETFSPKEVKGNKRTLIKKDSGRKRGW
jgi:hypothetical protein